MGDGAAREHPLSDARSFRVALIADEFVNPGPGGVDGLSVLEDEGWGAIQLPPDSYPSEVSAAILEHIAEQVDEFLRNAYDVVLIGSRRGVEDALRTRKISTPPKIRPASSNDIQAFLRGRPPPPSTCGPAQTSGRVEK
jgi:hypothetical protein